MRAAPQLGPAIYFALDKVSHYAARITHINADGTVDITTYFPSPSQTTLTRIDFDPDADSMSAKPGTCYAPSRN